MAEFNVTPPAAAPANYTGASQGISTSPNTAFETLFSGVADALNLGVQAADRHVKSEIEQDIFDASDQVLDEFGVSDATDFQADAEGPALPSQLERAGQNLDRLQTAYARGALKESHYWARMNSMVRQLRQKYPGYRGEIDEMVSSIVGGRPANQLRNSLFNEWASETADAPLPKLEDWAIKNGRLPMDYYERAQSQNPYTVTELSAHIANKTRQDAETADARAMIALSVDQGNVNTKQVEEAFRVEANQFVNGLISDTTGGIGQSYAVLSDRIKDAQQQAALGQPYDVAQLTAGINQLQSDIKLALHQKFAESWDGNSDHSYLAQLTTEQRDAAIQTAMTPVSILGEALTSENPFGLMNAVAANTKAKENAADAKLIEAIPVLESLQTLNRVVGPDVTSLYLSVSPQIQNALTQTLTDYAAAQASQGGSIAQSYQVGVETSQGPEYFNALTERWTKIAEQVSKGELPLDLVQSNVQYMFGPGSAQILSQLDDNSKFAYFQKVSSPAVTKQMLALRDMGDIDSWNAYQQWTTNAFMSLYQQTVQDLQSYNTNANYEGINVRWDPASKGFILRSSGMFGIGATEGPVQNFNSVIRTIAPIIEANGGDVEQELYGMMTQMGFDPEAAREKSLWGHFVEAMVEGVQNGMLNDSNLGSGGRKPQVQKSTSNAGNGN
jgi:hypothetical protein